MFIGFAFSPDSSRNPFFDLRIARMKAAFDKKKIAADSRNSS